MHSAQPEHDAVPDGAKSRRSDGIRLSQTHDWHGIDAEVVAKSFHVVPEEGLSVSEAAARLKTEGPNRLAAQKKESALHAFGRQYRDFMQILLVAASLVSLIVTKDIGTFLLLAGLTVFNAIIGLR